MTSATERSDEDVIVITDAHVVDSPRTDADETPDSDDRELSDDSDLQAGDADLGTNGGQLDDDELDDDELGASGERADHLTASEDATADGGAPSGSSAFAMPGGDSSADSTASAGSGPFAVPSTGPDDSLAEPDDSLAEPDDSLAEPSAVDTSPVDTSLADTSLADASAVDYSSADTSSADASAVDTSPADTSAVAASSAPQPDNSNWPEIQSMFVDDPRSAVERAAEVTGAALAALVAAAKDREQSLRSDWDADGTGTEELRTSLKHYRELATRLTGLSQEL
jgi:hypothetical protein